MKIDMHSHWRPPSLIEPMRQRQTAPHIVRNAEGIEVVKTRNTEEPVSGAFDDVQTKLAEMDRQGITTAVQMVTSGADENAHVGACLAFAQAHRGAAQRTVQAVLPLLR